jgi:hypothetical protein
VGEKLEERVEGRVGGMREKLDDLFRDIIMVMVFVGS